MLGQMYSRTTPRLRLTWLLTSVLMHVVSRAGGILFPPGALSRLPRHCARARPAHDAVSYRNRIPSLILHRTLLL